MDYSCEYSQIKVNLSSKSKDIVKNILIELSIELTGTKSIPKLADKLNLSKQALYAWISEGEIPLESIVSKVKGINPRFLTGEEKRIYKVEAQPSDDYFDFTKTLLEEERSRYGISKVPDTEVGRYLQDILDDSVSLVVKIRRLIDLHEGSKIERNSDP